MFVFMVLHGDALELLMHEIADLSRANEKVHRIQASLVPLSFLVSLLTIRPIFYMLLWLFALPFCC